MRPAVGAKYPAIMFMVVDFPAPFRPSRPRICPFSTEKDSSLTAV